MNFCIKFVKILDSTMEQPTLYGWFHLMWLGIVIGSSVLLCYLYKKGIIKNVRAVLLTVSITVMVLELYKIFISGVRYDNGIIEYKFLWHTFPWQFCSTPMYMGLIAGLTKGKVHDFCCSFLATFAVFAGVAIMVYPDAVFISTIGVNIQTMICHGSMIVVGVFLYYTNTAKTKFTTLFKGAAVFSICVTIAMIINEIGHATGISDREYLNMFYISRYEEPHLPVYSIIQENVSFYPLCLAIYIIGFTVAACLMLLAAMGIKKLGAKFNKKKEN